MPSERPFVGHWDYGAGDDREAAITAFLSVPASTCVKCRQPATHAIEGELSGVGKYYFLIQPVCDNHADEVSSKHGGVVATVRAGEWSPRNESGGR